jgi:[ribosomal protein S5]-alanine N-acetyltransferase
MAFLRGSVGTESYVARGAKVGLRPLTMTDYAAWSQLRAQSREHLVPWEPIWPRDELLKSAYRRRLRYYQREQREDLGYAFGVFALADDQLLGGLSLSNVRRGVTQAAQLGYWIGLPHVRQGYMSDAVLERNGFEREGFARKYLKINGEWHDHILFGLLAEDHQAGASARREQRAGVAAL